MTQDHSEGNFRRRAREQSWSGLNYYKLLDLTPAASGDTIRQAYRCKSKLYHPDTTQLPAEIATERFRQLNHAYATLSNPQKRLQYDYQLGLIDIGSLNTSSGASAKRQRVAQANSQVASTVLEVKDRALSAGELFALFILGLTFIGCLVLAIVVGLNRGEVLLQTANVPGWVQPLTILFTDKSVPMTQLVAPKLPTGMTVKPVPDSQSMQVKHPSSAVGLEPSSNPADVQDLNPTRL